MTFNEYMIESKRTLAPLDSLLLNNLHLTSGIVTELGELYQALKKKDRKNIGEEIGDCCWYVANYCRINDLPFRVYPSKPLEDLLPCCTELLDLHKKELAYNKEVNYKTAEKYCQSILYWLHGEAVKLDTTLNDLFQININKLKVRFPEKFTQAAAIERDVEKEALTL